MVVLEFWISGAGVRWREVVVEVEVEKRKRKHESIEKLLSSHAFPRFGEAEVGR